MPGATVIVGAEVGGRVVAVQVVEGDMARRGSVLATLDRAEARAALEEARARLAESEAHLAFLPRHYDRIDSLRHGDHVSAEELDAVTRDCAVAQAQVLAARATVDRLTATLAKRVVRAPIAGRVVARSVEPGQTVAQGTPLFTIADLSRRRVEAEADEFDIAHLRIEAPVAITAEGYEDSTWTGHVTSIPERVIPQRLRPEDPVRPSDIRVLLVRVDIPKAAPFKLGQRVELRIGVPWSRAP